MVLILISIGIKLAPRRYEFGGLYIKLLGDCHEIRLMRLEEANQRGEKTGVACPASKFICPNSGQIEEPAGPPLVSKRCC